MPNWQVLNRIEAERRKRSLKQASDRIAKLLDNAKGLARLLDISDEEWQQAQSRDEENAT